MATGIDKEMSPLLFFEEFTPLRNLHTFFNPIFARSRAIPWIEIPFEGANLSMLNNLKRC